jgi:antitoxin MazE
MSTTIRGRVVKIGNSQGIRIPKTLLEQSGIGSDVEIEVHNHTLVIRSAQQSRRGWDEAFAQMTQQGDDVLLDQELFTEWEQTEWEW